MRRISFLILVAVLTLGVLLFAKRPEILQEFQAWFLGLIPPAIALFQLIWKKGLTVLQNLENKIFSSKNKEQ